MIEMTVFADKNADDFITRAELADAALLSVKTLERYAREGLGPKVYKIGARRVAYRVGEVREWFDRAVE